MAAVGGSRTEAQQRGSNCPTSRSCYCLQRHIGRGALLSFCICNQEGRESQTVRLTSFMNSLSVILKLKRFCHWCRGKQNYALPQGGMRIRLSADLSQCWQEITMLIFLKQLLHTNKRLLMKVGNLALLQNLQEINI